MDAPEFVSPFSLVQGRSLHTAAQAGSNDARNFAASSPPAAGEGLRRSSSDGSIPLSRMRGGMAGAKGKKDARRVSFDRGLAMAAPRRARESFEMRRRRSDASAGSEQRGSGQLAIEMDEIAALERLESDQAARRTSRLPARPSMAMRISSVPSVFSLDRPDAWRDVDMSDRRGFGVKEPLLLGLSRAPSDGANRVLRALAICSEATEESRSLVPLLKTIPTVGGKICVALGADLLSIGVSQRRTPFTWGGSLVLFAGCASVVLGIAAFLTDMRKINPARTKPTIILTAVGISVVAGGLVLGESDVGQINLAIRSVAAVMIGVGLTVLNTSYPLCFAYSEIVHGDVVRQGRSEIIFALWGIGLGLATGLTLSRGVAHDKVVPKIYPFGVSHAAAVLGISSAALGTCFAATNQQRMHARVLALRARNKNMRRA